MSRLSEISTNPMLRQFAQGAAQSAIMPVADFIAPTIEVPTSTGRYKKYTEKNRFHIPKTLRTLGGRASELRFEVNDETYNCEPHALDYPVDNLEQLEAQGLENMLREGAVAVAEVAALAHEKSVIDLAVEAVGPGSDLTWNDAADPVADIDDAILDVIKACKYGSLMGVGVLFGASAWNVFKNQAKVRGRFVVGSGARTGVGLAVPTQANAGQMFIGSPEVRTSYMVYDDAPEGIDEDINFLLDSAVLVFARKAQPSRRDPSFMKTFRLMNQFMVPGSYMRDDGRVEVAKFDWSEDVKVCNNAAAHRLNIATA
ncbi:hypothetical protein PDESU_03196 [Pontiella desulfatans]|uniref:Major capsid protein n=1 Tax=Pontiella desulfatans TaxID=2750659 RepID=A0A6C2U515_PONDE|nr:hypothetical protein [Pontiella desulfatans]VGO14631.1 hypothetical protein PDESU_03196 [Pontiella desulfatans]